MIRDRHSVIIFAHRLPYTILMYMMESFCGWKRRRMRGLHILYSWTPRIPYIRATNRQRRLCDLDLVACLTPGPRRESPAFEHILIEGFDAVRLLQWFGGSRRLMRWFIFFLNLLIIINSMCASASIERNHILYSCMHFRKPRGLLYVLCSCVCVWVWVECFMYQKRGEWVAC